MENIYVESGEVVTMALCMNTYIWNVQWTMTMTIVSCRVNISNGRQERDRLTVFQLLQGPQLEGLCTEIVLSKT